MFGFRKPAAVTPAPSTPPTPTSAPDRLARLQEYWSGGFQAIEGWVNPDLLRSLQLVDEFQQERGIRGGALEIGLHHGKFFIPLLLLRQPGEAGVGIDVFEDQAKNVDSSGLGSRAQVEANLRRHVGEAHDVQLMQRDTLSLNTLDRSELLRANGPFRLVSIDGGHTRTHCVNDLLFAQDILQNGGVIILDDFITPHWPGVMEGVATLFLQHAPRIAPVAWGLNKLFLTDFTHQRALFERFAHAYGTSPGFKPVKLYTYDTIAF
jgi:hypothetical protein